MASDWWGVAMALGTAAAQGYMAKKNAQAQQKDAEHAMNEWERAQELQRQNMYEARNSPFAKVGMTMLDQMLHVYGDQSKGRGGFTLPVDQLSSMLGGFGSFGNAENRQTIAGANPDASTGWYTSNGNPGMGGDSVPPQMRELIEQRKADFAASRTAGAGIGGGGGILARGGIQRRADSVFDAGQSYGGLGSGFGGGAPSFDQMFSDQHRYMSGLRDEEGNQKYFNESLVSPEQMARFNIWARENANEHPMIAKAMLGLLGNTVGGLPGMGMAGMIPGSASGLVNQYAFGPDENITSVYGQPSYYFGKYRAPVYNPIETHAAMPGMSGAQPIPNYIPSMGNYYDLM